MKAKYSATLQHSGLGEEIPCTISFNDQGLIIENSNVSLPQSVSVDALTHVDYLVQGVLVINFGDYPYHVLRVYDKEALQDFKQSFPKHPHTKKLSKSAGKTIGFLVFGVIAGFIALLALFYFLLLPLFAGWAATKVSPEFERSLGKQMKQSYLLTEKEDTAASRIATAFFKSLSYSNADSVEITVIESKEINAFALPGGFIFLPKGMIKALETPGQMAALLSHEFVHARNKHSLRNMIASASGKITLMIFAGGLDDGAISLLLSSGEDLRSLGFSRDLESESDRVGMELMAESGIQPAEMVSLLEILSKSAGVQPPEFLSTHPVFEERIPDAKEIAKGLSVQSQKKMDESLFTKLKGQ